MHVILLCLSGFMAFAHGSLEDLHTDENQAVTKMQCTTLTLIHTYTCTACDTVTIAHDYITQ